MSANSSSEPVYQVSQLIPSKGLLNSILDRLQKKDKFGIFADPVDEKEVPNYFDIIKEPMDFGTMRSRISSSNYTSLELFQRDVFLICENAMQYNGKGTVYFRHARAIKDAAERIMEDLKLSGEIDEPAIKLKSGGTSRINDKHDLSMTAGSPSETQMDNLDEVSGYLLKASVSVDGKRSQAFDENCRNTYAPLPTVYQSKDSLLTSISGDSLHLVPTGYQMDLPYSKSLTQFTADLGPLVKKIAVEKITKSLPPGCPSRQGWVEEWEAGGILINASSKLVGDLETCGVFSMPSSQWALPGQAAAGQTAKVPCLNATITNLETSALPAVELKPENQSRSQFNDESATYAERQPTSLQDPTNLPLEIRSPMVFGNSPAQVEMPEGADQGVPGQSINQPMACLSSPGRPLQSCRDSEVKLDQMSLLVGIESKFAGQVNLNHPLILLPDEGGSVNDCASVRDPAVVRRDVVESDTAGPVTATPHVGNVGGFPFVESFNSEGTFTSVTAQIDKLNPMKVRMGESTRNQYDGRCATQINQCNPLNDITCMKAGLTAPSVGITEANYQANNSRVTHGPVLAYNMNTSLQHSLATKRSSSDSFCSTLSQPQLAYVFPLQSRLINGFQKTAEKTAEGMQQSISIDCKVSRDISPLEQALCTIPAPPCLKRVIGEKLSESGDLRERENSSLAGRMTSELVAAVPNKGCYPDKGYCIQHLEGKNGQITRCDMVVETVDNLEQLNRKQNTSGGLSAASFATIAPSCNGISMACEVSSWVPAQQQDSARVNGKGGAQFPSQVRKNHLECFEIPSGGGVLPMRLQTSRSQDPHIYSFGTKKHKSNMPHFLQQQLVGNNSHATPSQSHQVEPHMKSNSLLSDARNLSPSDSMESNFAGQFQPSSYPSFSQASTLPCMSAQMVAHGSYQPPLAMAPDLNVSLPLTKSSFDQPIGSVQQPDLALQL